MTAEPSTERAPVEMQRAFMQTASRLPTIFDYGEDFLNILAVIADAEERGEDPSDALAQLETLQTALAQKVENYVSLIRELSHFADARKVESERMAQRAKSAERAALYLRDRLKQFMLSTDQQRIETARHTIALVANPPRVEVLEEALIPQEFKKTVVSTSIDKRGILQHLKDTGEVVDGVNVVREQRVDFR